MASKHKHKGPTAAVRSLTFTYNDDSEPLGIQRNVILHATADSCGHSSTQTTYTSLIENKEFPGLHGIFDDDNDSQINGTYGGEEFIAPLEDNPPLASLVDNPPLNIIEYEVPDVKDCNTVSCKKIVVANEDILII